jgi:dihydroorotase (homodimeric type)
MENLTLTRPDDWHLHLRDGEALKAVLPHTVRQFARAIVMPNLKPPIRSVADAAAYRDRITAAIPTGKQFEPLMTLYLTDNTSPEEIIAAKASQFVKAVKYYPAGATTNSDLGKKVPVAVRVVIRLSTLWSYTQKFLRGLIPSINLKRLPVSMDLIFINSPAIPNRLL